MHDHHPPSSSPAHHDVLIAGGGPVGLFLACELRLAGISVLVLERSDTASSPLKQPPFGIRGLSAPTIEAFRRRRMLDQIEAPRPDAPDSPRPAHRPGGHFAGIPFAADAIDASTWPYRLPRSAPTNIATSMERIETVLTARARALGVDIRRGTGVDDIASSDDGVIVHAGRRTFRGRWLVGCDGGRSTVRKVCGFDVAGTDAEFTGYSVQVAIADAGILTPGRTYTPHGLYVFTPPGTVAMVDFDGGAFHRSDPITLEHVQSVLRRMSGTDVTLTALDLATTWTDRAFQAVTYRKGRVLLAGDAAHIHSPLGGQGLNLGLGDAMNLGWKLAATIRGDAPDALLDSYTRERHPVGAEVLDWSRAQVELMRPSRHARALAAIVRDLIGTRDGATYVAERVWGLALRYDLGDDHPLVGRSAPEFVLTDGTALSTLLADGRGLLLDFDGRERLRSLADGWSDRFRYVGCDVTNRLGLDAVLVRPDGIVAWVGEEGARDQHGAAPAASRWFGSPRTIAKRAGL